MAIQNPIPSYAHGSERLEGLVGKLTSHLFGPSAANEADKEENE